MDAGVKPVVIKTAGGTEEALTLKEVKARGQVTVHQTESARRKVAHLVKRVG